MNTASKLRAKLTALRSEGSGAGTDSAGGAETRERPKPRRLSRREPVSTATTSGSAGTLTSTSRPSTGNSTTANALEFSVGGIEFNRAEEVGPGDPPSSLEVGELDYYLERKRDFESRHPDLEVPDYYEDYGDRYIREFDELSPDLSEDGQEWVAETRENLQQAFEDLIAEDPEAFDRLEQDPEALREWAFDSHSEAYLDAGFAELPPEDILQIATTPSFEDFIDEQALKEAVEVGVQAVVSNPSLVAEVPAEVLEQVNSFIADGVIEVGDEIAMGFGDLTDAALDAAGDVAEGVFDGAADATDFIPGPISDILEGAGDVVGSIFDGAGNAGEGLFDGLGGIFEEVVGGGTEVINSVIDAAGGVLGQVIETPIEIIDSVIDLDGPAETVGEILGEGVDLVGDVVSGGADIVSDAGGAVIDAGGDLLEGAGDVLGGIL